MDRITRCISTALRLGLALALLMAALATAACTTTSKIWKPYDRVSITASKDVNPDGNQRPSPIQIKIYQLASRTTFDNLDFDKLFYQGETLLSDQLLSHATFIVQPKQSIEHELQLKENVGFVAVIAAYREVDSSRWKHIYPVKPHGHYRHTLSLGPSGIVEGEVADEELVDESTEPKHSRKRSRRRNNR